MSINQLPQIIILVGPSNAGKGTQSAYLKKLFSERYHLDFGSALRLFVNRHISDGGLVNYNSKHADMDVALRLKHDMSMSNPVKIEDLKYVVESAIIDCIKNGQDMIVEGPGRTVEEAQWLSKFIDSQNAKVCIFHIHISVEEAQERAANRWYVNDKPFMSFELAKATCKNGEEPIKRNDDKDPEGIKNRFISMYSKNFALITSIYQLGCKAELFTLDGRKKVDEVSGDIALYLERFYSWKN